jgi:hypothetical protein
MRAFHRSSPGIFKRVASHFLGLALFLEAV